MRRHNRLVKLLSIMTMTFFLLGNILTPVWAGQSAIKNTFAAPGVIDPFGPLDPGGWCLPTGRKSPGRWDTAGLLTTTSTCRCTKSSK